MRDIYRKPFIVNPETRSTKERWTFRDSNRSSAQRLYGTATYRTTLFVRTRPNSVCYLHQGLKEFGKLILLSDANGIAKFTLDANASHDDVVEFYVDDGVSGPQGHRFRVRAGDPTEDMPPPPVAPDRRKSSRIRPALSDEEAHSHTQQYLAEHGYPRRPENDRGSLALSRWFEIVNRDTEIVEPTSVELPTTSSNVVQTQKSSNNYSGFLLSSNVLALLPYIAISAEWAIPSTWGRNLPGRAIPQCSTWVGFNGISQQGLWQAGTEHDAQILLRIQPGPGGLHNLHVSAFNASAPYAWFEFQPDSNQNGLTSFAVAVGDEITCEVSLVARWDAQGRLQPAARGKFQLNNITQGTTVSQTVNFVNATCSGQTAEWIVERPEENNVLAPLAAYGQLVMSNAFAYPYAGGQLGFQGGTNDPSTQMTMYDIPGVDTAAGSSQKVLSVAAPSLPYTDDATILFQWVADI